MLYRKYPDIPHTYIMHHTEGVDVQGNLDRRVKEIVGSGDDYESLKASGELMYPHPTSWEFDRYTINVNTSTEAGKTLEAEMHEGLRISGERFAKFEAEHPDQVMTFKIGDSIIKMKKNKALDETVGISTKSFPHVGILMPSKGLLDKNNDPIPIELYAIRPHLDI